MSETPEEERPAAAPPPEPPPSAPAPATAPPPNAAARPSAPASRPVHQNRGFQLAAVGVIGLLLGGMIGLAIGLTVGFAFSHQDRPGHHQQWGPRDGYRQPDRKVPNRPFAPPQRKQPGQVTPSPALPSPQTS